MSNAQSAASPIKAPSTFLTMTELHRAALEFSTLPLAAPFLSRAPKGDGHSVLVLPGFIAGDTSTDPMRRYLRHLGYDAHAWDLGRNLGPHAIGRQGEKLMERLATIFAASGRKVSLVGWSLGGLFARELAKMRPDDVRIVVSLGSPFAGREGASNANGVYRRFNPKSDVETIRFPDLKIAPPVPTTSIYSRSDGIVAWPCSIQDNSPFTENIEVDASHIGMGAHPAVLRILADRLAQPEGTWRPHRNSDKSAKRERLFGGSRSFAN